MTPVKQATNDQDELRPRRHFITLQDGSRKSSCSPQNDYDADLVAARPSLTTGDDRKRARSMRTDLSLLRSINRYNEKVIGYGVATGLTVITPTEQDYPVHSLSCLLSQRLAIEIASSDYFSSITVTVPFLAKIRNRTVLGCSRVDNHEIRSTCLFSFYFDFALRSCLFPEFIF